MSSPVEAALPSSCTITLPTPTSTPSSFLSRWSNTGVSLPHAIVNPATPTDIIKTIQYAALNSLKIVPVGGGHGSAVPITDRTICLPLSKFQDIKLDEEKGEVGIGGGALTGDVLKYLAEKGWYTCSVNSNAVGVVGALLGGFSHGLVGKHGLGVDYIRTINIIPFSMPDGSPPTSEIVLSKESQGEEKKLWNALRGGGHGLGVITSVTLSAYRISSLNVTDGKIWTRRLIFPAPAIDTAISTFLKFLSPSAALAVSLVFLRAPPTAPVPGAPMIMLGLSYHGPAADAEKISASTYEEGVVEKAITTMTVMTEWAAVNTGLDALNRHGGYKDFHGGWLQTITPSSIHSAFTQWLSFTSVNPPSRSSSYVVINFCSTSKSLINSQDNPTPFIPFRERGIFVHLSPWYAEETEKKDADAFGQSVLQAVRESDAEAGRRAWGFANNWTWGQNANDVFGEKEVEELRRVRRGWDGKCVGWNPVADGW